MCEDFNTNRKVTKNVIFFHAEMQNLKKIPCYRLDLHGPVLCRGSQVMA